jgi:hypothetical protein
MKKTFRMEVEVTYDPATGLLYTNLEHPSDRDLDVARSLPNFGYDIMSNALLTEYLKHDIWLGVLGIAQSDEYVPDKKGTVRKIVERVIEHHMDYFDDLYDEIHEKVYAVLHEN